MQKASNSTLVKEGITGVTIVEMPDEEAVRMQRELPNASILRDRPIELIQPERNVAGTKNEVTAADLWHLEAIALNTARQQGFTGTGKNITVAILDTGINDRHPELQGKIAESYSLNDRTQQIQSIPSQDTHGHGTHVASNEAYRQALIDRRKSQVISCPYKQLRYPALAPGPSPKHGRGVPEGRGEGSYNKSLTGHDITEEVGGTIQALRSFPGWSLGMHSSEALPLVNCRRQQPTHCVPTLSRRNEKD